MFGADDAHRPVARGIRPPKGPWADAGWGSDGVLALLECLAGQGAVVTLAADGRAIGPPGDGRWALAVLDGRPAVRGAAPGECARMLLPALTGAAPTVSGAPTYAVPDAVAVRADREGTGLLLLDWLADHGAYVFLKADGDRPRPGWTLLARGGPVPGPLRADGPDAGRCLQALVADLRAHGLTVPL
ncbi:hypothetical protein ACFWNK_29835 [Streptomyces sp. NPDC058417]|uniref:hypothetical protein n=1 Tax=unclassified Streptomyces TaxID=2593676 RepID=UPI0036536753